MDIYTAQYRYAGPDRLDITVSNKNNTWGRVFAPTWDMVMGHKNGVLSNEDYTKRYHELMNNSMGHNIINWNYLYTLERVVFVCFCPAGAFCHRVVFANMIHPMAPHFTYHGEIQM